MFLEIVQDGLPAKLLPFSGIFVFHFESFAYFDAVGHLGEDDFDATVVAEDIFN